MMRSQGRAAAVAQNLVVGLAFTVLAVLAGESQAAWRQTRFLIGGYGVNAAPFNPLRLVRLDAAGLDFIQNFDHPIPYGRILVAQLDSLRQARPGFRLQAIVHHAAPASDPSRATANGEVAEHWRDIRRMLGEKVFLGPSTLGWCVWDEPATAREIDNSGELSRRMRGDPSLRDRLPFVNLLPIAETGRDAAYQGSFGLGKDRRAAYEAYLDAYLSQFDGEPEPAPLLSFDHYLFQNDRRARDDYFENLEIARDRAAAHSRPGARIPLWVVIQLASFKPLGSPFMRQPTLAQVRWSAWTAVAYGAKSISYWTTGTIDDPAPRTGYRGGLLELDGRPTSKYEPIRRLNAELHALGPTLMTLDPVTVLHVAAGEQRERASDQIGAPSRVYGIVSAVEGAGRQDCMIGYFKQQGTGQDFLLVVNRSLTTARTFTVRLGASANAIVRYDPRSGNAGTPLRDSAAFVVRDLPAASAVLYRIDGPLFEYLPGVREVRGQGETVDYVLPAGVLRVEYASGRRRWVDRAMESASTNLRVTPSGVARAAR